MKFVDISFQADAWYLEGELDFSNVMSVYLKSLPQLKHSKKISIDFSKLKTSNSAGLVLLLEWLKYAKQHKKNIELKNISPDILSIAQLARVDHLLPV